jgi:hypothetical protein
VEHLAHPVADEVLGHLELVAFGHLLHSLTDLAHRHVGAADLRREGAREIP